MITNIESEASRITHERPLYWDPALADGNGQPKEFGRWRDVQNIYGVKRGLLHLLVLEGKIKSVLVRRRGNVHGTRYYFMPSVASYLHNLMDEQTQEKNQNLSASAGLESDPKNKNQPAKQTPVVVSEMPVNKLAVGRTSKKI